MVGVTMLVEGRPRNAVFTVRASQRENRKLREIANELVWRTTGSLETDGADPPA